jgi:SSS family solute:Na+ symporter
VLARSLSSGAFIIPMIAALFNLPYNKRFSIAAMLSGGILALSGKLMMTFGHLETGQYVLISGFILNALLLFIPFGRETGTAEGKEK